MPRIEKKLEQIQLQHHIAKLIWKDNGVSSHFDYHVNMNSDDQTIMLNVLTFNENHNEYMLLYSASGSSAIACLQKTLAYLKTKLTAETLYTFTIHWNKKGEHEKHVSYFRASTMDQAIEKFLHEKDPTAFDYSVVMNPLS